IADPGVVGTGPDAFRIEQRAERNVTPQVARQLVADLGVALSGNRADIDADRSARDKMRAPFAERSEVDRKTRTFEQGRQPLGAGALVAGRVDRSEADKVLRELD